MNRQVEICVSDLASAEAAQAGGADRIELCVDLASGGLTPSLGLISCVVDRLSIPTHVLIRPRAGDFVYSEAELRVIVGDIRHAGNCGVAGIVIGASQSDGRIDIDVLSRLVEAGRPLSVTVHKAIDLTPDPLDAVERLCNLGVDRLLTSGGLGPARGNLSTLRAMRERAAGRLVVMVGGGIEETDLPDLLNATGIDEVHLGSGVTAGPNPPGPFGASPPRVIAEKVARIVAKVRGR